MGGKGPAPKPKHMKQHRIKKAGATTLSSEHDNKKSTPRLQNPDGREWHSFTKSWWKRVWDSPMASEFLPTDVDGLARLALLVDEYYKNPKKDILAEVRLQEARFGLSPVDRSRLQWEVQKGEEAERKRKPLQQQQEQTFHDPRGLLGVVK